MHTFLYRKTNDLTVRINKLEESSNQQISIMKGNIEESKEIIQQKRVNSREGNIA